MWLAKQKARFKELYEQFPRPFWVLTGVSFIDQVGGALLYPFFALYITQRFGVGMTEVGIIFGLYSVSSFAGQLVGGAISDRFGRRFMLIFSLIVTSTSALAMGVVDSLLAFYALALVVGLFVESGQPARQAMVADLLPEEKHAQGYGIIRVAFNLAVAIGPAIGGFLAARSFLSLFVADAIISLIAATLVWRFMPETKPDVPQDELEESVARSFRGYSRVLRDRTFMLYIGASVLIGLVYMNLFTTLGVFLRDAHGVPASGYGLLLSLNAALVVIFQFPIARRVERYAPMYVMALGALLYGLGFGMYALASTFVLFTTAMVILTIGEMFIVPVSQALVARFAPEDMRGRYMAIYGFSWSLPFAVGPILAGTVMDNADPRLLYVISGFLGVLAAGAFLGLHPQVRAEPATALSEAAD